jgi:putative cell wall-binding protein
VSKYRSMNRIMKLGAVAVAAIFLGGLGAVVLFVTDAFATIAYSTSTLVTQSSPAGTPVTGQTVTLTATVTNTTTSGVTPTGQVIFYEKTAGTSPTTPIPGCSSVTLSGGAAHCTTHFDASGSRYTITATYEGTGTTFGTSGSKYLETVNKANTTTAVTGTGISTTGAPVTLTATVTVTSPGAGTPGGTVAFYETNNPITGCTAVTLISAKAHCTTSFTSTTSPYSITAKYSGNTTFTTSTSSAATQTVKGKSTTTTAVTGYGTSVTGQPVTLTATVTSAGGTPTGGTVAFYESTTPISGCTARPVASGTAHCSTSFKAHGSPYSIHAKYSGNTSFKASPTSATVTQTVNRATTTTAVTGNGTSVASQPVTLTATVTAVSPGTGTPTGGTVAFYKTGSLVSGCTARPVTGGTAHCTTTFAKKTSPYAIRAQYSGNTTFKPSPTSPLVTQTVSTKPSTTTTVSGNGISVTGQPVTLTATVAPVSPGTGTPTGGTVAFYKTGASISGCTAKAVTSGQAHCTTSFKADTSPYQITAKYSGTSTLKASPTSTPVTQTVKPAKTTTTVSGNGSTVTGQPVTLTATVSVTSPGAGTPASGTVAFYKTGALISGCTAKSVTAGLAHCTTTFKAHGSPYSIHAVYSGNTTFKASAASATVTQTVSKAATKTVVSGNGTSVTGARVTLTATVTATTPGAGTPTGGTVEFYVTGTPISGCTARSVSSGAAHCTTTFKAHGSPYSIHAKFLGNTTFSPSATSPNVSETVSKATTTTAVTGNGTSVTGQAVTFTATVSPVLPGGGTPTGGTVAFYETGTALGACATQPVSSGAAHCSIVFKAHGSPYTIKARYSGNTTFKGSLTSPTVSQTVNKATTTTVVSGIGSSVATQHVTLTATVAAVSPGAGTPSSGTVAFYETGTSISGCTAKPVSSGAAHCTTTFKAPGSPHSVKAKYSGDLTYKPSPTSAVFTETVTSKPTTATAVTGNGTSVTGQPVTLTATVTVTVPGSGTPTGGVVEFFSKGSPIPGCTAKPVTAGKAHCTTSFKAATSTYAIHARYGGDTTLKSSPTSLTVIQTVDKATTSTVVTGNGTSVAGQPVTFTATVTPQAPGGGTVNAGHVEFYVTGAPISGCTAQPVTSGVAHCTTTFKARLSAYAVKAGFLGNGNYKASSTTVSQTVNKATTTTTVTMTTPASGTPVTGQSVTFSATVSAKSPGAGTPAGKVDFSYEANGASSFTAMCTTVSLSGGTATCTTSSLVASGSAYTIQATYAGTTPTFSGSSNTLTQTVLPATTATTLVKTAPTGTPVTGEPVTFSATVAAVSPGAGTPAGKVDFSYAPNGGSFFTAMCTTVSLTSGHYTCTTTALGAVGSAYTIQATFFGTATFGASSMTLSQTVKKATTTTTLTKTAPSGTPVTGESVTFSATVAAKSPGAGTPSGKVDFSFEANGGSTFTAMCTTVSPTSGHYACTTTALGASGSAYTIKADYLGTATFLASTKTLAQTVTKATTTTVVTGNGISVTGQPVTFTATVSVVSPGSGTVNGGMVEFYATTLPISGCTAEAVTAGKAHCTKSFIAATSPYGIQAKYLGDPTFNASATSATVAQTVKPAKTTTAVTGNGTSVTGQPVTFTATVTATAPGSGTPTGGTVAFYETGTPIAGCTAKPVAAGTAHCTTNFIAATSPYEIHAKFSGNTTYKASPTSATVTQTVNKATTTTTLTKTAPAGTPVTGESVTFSATVAAKSPGAGTPSGKVDFSYEANGGSSFTAMCTTVSQTSGTYTCSTTALKAAGSAYTIKASYLGTTSTFNGSTKTLAQTVNKATTTTTLTKTAPAGTPVTGESVTFSATVAAKSPGAGTPSGKVDFSYEANGASSFTKMCTTVTVSAGHYTCTTSAPSASGSPYTIKAAFLGTATFLASTKTLAQTVTAPVTPGGGGGGGGGSTPPTPPPGPGVTRVSGTTADATAAAEFERAFPSTKGNCPASHAAVLATTKEYEDALSSQFLSQSLTTGTLLTPTTSLAPVTASTLKKEGITTVYVVGGRLAITTTVVKAIQNLTAYGCGGTFPSGKVTVHRFSGATAEGTAMAIAEHVGTAASLAFPGAYSSTGKYNDTSGNGSGAPSGSVPTAILASAQEFQDAEAASVVSYHTKLPLLLTQPNALSTTAAAALTALRVKQVILMGGPFALSNTVEAALVAKGISVLRIAGKDATDTARELARFEAASPTSGLGWTPGHRIMVTRGDGFTDGIAGAVLDSPHNSATGAGVRPLLLTESPTVVGTHLTTFLEVTGHTGIDGTRGKTVTSLTVLGGTLAVSTAAVAEMQTDLNH